MHTLKNKTTILDDQKGRSEIISYYLSFQFFLGVFFGSYEFKLKITEKMEDLKLQFLRLTTNKYYFLF